MKKFIISLTYPDHTNVKRYVEASNVEEAYRKLKLTSTEISLVTSVLVEE